MGRTPSPLFDLVIVGGGIAGTAVASEIQRRRPSWAIELHERTDRIGGRLRSVHVEGLDHPIELGGMRFLTSQARVATLVDTLGLQTHPFDPTDGAGDRVVLRGTVFGADDPAASRTYDLPIELRGRTATELATMVFDQVVPGFRSMDHAGYVARRATGRLLDRPVTALSIGEALEAFLGPEGHRFVNDAFGYDSGMRAFCAPDLVEFLAGGGDPTARALSPLGGMDEIPRALAAAFERLGGAVRLGSEIISIEPSDDGIVRLTTAAGATILTARVVLAVPLPALRLLASGSAPLRSPAFADVIESVEAFPAMKAYLWYDRPWWRPAVAGIRTTTDRPIRKVFYFDGAPGSRSVLLGMYTDGRDTDPWRGLAGDGPPGRPVPPAMLEQIQRELRAAHPDIADLPNPVGSALMTWGSDPHETGWHFWRAGVNSDDVLAMASRPDPDLAIYIANEAFSRHQSWVEGALEAAAAAAERLLDDRAA